MRHIIGSLFAALLFALSAGTGLADEAKICKLHRYAHLDMALDGAGRPVVPVTINGTPLRFVVDTAGIYNGISEAAVEKLGLKYRKVRDSVVHHGVSGAKMKGVATADKFVIGAIPVDKMEFMVLPPEMSAPDSDGIISGGFLHVFDIEIDFAGGKFSIFLQTDCGARYVHWTKEPYGELPFEMNKKPMNTGIWIIQKGRDWHITARAKLDGVDVDAVFDTGASTSFMTVEEAMDVLPSGTKIEDFKRLGEETDPEKAYYSYPFKTLEIGGIRIDNPMVVMHRAWDNGASRRFQSRPQLILGVSVMRHLRLYIAYKEKKMYFTSAEAH